MRSVSTGVIQEGDVSPAKREARRSTRVLLVWLAFGVVIVALGLTTGILGYDIAMLFYALFVFIWLPIFVAVFVFWLVTAGMKSLRSRHPWI
jgi:uncharacterized membrane protein